jgi:hypothetical protein
MADLFAPPSKEEMNSALMAPPSPEELGLKSSPKSSDIQMGQGEALMRALEQGGTLGFGDELNGALETGVNKLTGKDAGMDMMDAYRKHRDESRAAMDAGEEQYPKTSFVGNLAGGLAPALATMGGSLPEQGMLALAKTGAKYGAAQALGNSTADLTQNDMGQVGQAAKDTAIGGALGAGLAPVADVVGQKIMDPLGKLLGGIGSAASTIADIGPIRNLIEAFKQGAVYNRTLTGKGANKAINQELIDTSRGIEGDLQSNLNAVMKQKMDALTRDGDSVNVKDWYQNALSGMKNLKAKYGQNEAVLNDITKVQDLLERHVFGSEPDGIPGKGLIFGTEDAENLLRQLGSLGSQGDASLKTKEGSELVNRLVSPLNREENLIDRSIALPKGSQSLSELINTSRPELPGLNSRASSLLKAKDQIPSVNDIANLEKTSLGGVNSTDRIQQFLDVLPKDIGDKYSGKMQELAGAKTIADKISAPGLSHGAIADSARGTLYSGANWAGKTTRFLYDMTPESLKTLAGTIGTIGGDEAKRLSNVLTQAADRDRLGRNALFFAIEQNPLYREVLRKATGDTSTEKVK